MRHLFPILAILLSCAATALAEGLPDGVMARVHGHDVTETDVYLRLAKKHRESSTGKEVLALLVEDLLVEQEAAKRGIGVSAADVRTYLEKVDQKIRYDSGGTKTLENVFREQGSTRRDFEVTARQFLLRQEMARKDLGWKPRPRKGGGRGVHLDDVPKHRVALWLSSLKRRHPVITEGLPAGQLARVGNRTVDRLAFAKAVSNKLPPTTVRGLLGELVLEAAARRDLRQAGIVIGTKDLDEEIARQTSRFLERPEIKGSGVTYDQFLRQVRGHGVAELRDDPGFRAALGLRRLLLRDITDDDLRAHWQKNRPAYGERAMVRYVYVAAGTSEAKFKLPSWKDAYDLALRAKVRILNGAGIGMKPVPGKTWPSLAHMVTRVAKQFTTDPARRQRAGEPEVWTRASVAGEKELEKAAFDEETGSLRGPLRTAVGYYVVLCPERRPAPRFEQIENDVREDVLRIALRRYRLRLRAGDDVVYAE